MLIYAMKGASNVYAESLLQVEVFSGDSFEDHAPNFPKEWAKTHWYRLFNPTQPSYVE